MSLNSSACTRLRLSLLRPSPAPDPRLSFLSSAIRPTCRASRSSAASAAARSARSGGSESRGANLCDDLGLGLLRHDVVLTIRLNDVPTASPIDAARV